MSTLSVTTKFQEGLAQSVATLERLLSISRQLNSTLEMRPLLQLIVDSARELRGDRAARHA